MLPVLTLAFSAASSTGADSLSAVDGAAAPTKSSNTTSPLPAIVRTLEGAIAMVAAISSVPFVTVVPPV